MNGKEVADLTGVSHLSGIVRKKTRLAIKNNQNTIEIKGQLFTFKEITSSTTRGKAYQYTPIDTIIKKRKTVSKEISFAHLAELDGFDITASKHTKKDKLSIITFMKKYNYSLKVIIESLLAKSAIDYDTKTIETYRRKIQRWKTTFEKHGASALEDSRGKTRDRFQKIDKELLKRAIIGAGSRGIRDNYYGIYNFYCFAYQEKHQNTFDPNRKVITYQALTKAIKSLLKEETLLDGFYRYGKDALLQAYPVGIKDITYPNQEWQVDATKFDFICRYIDSNGNPKMGRLNLTAVIDVYTGNVVATLSETINSYDQIRVLYKAFERMGLPEQIYTDNGKDYVSYHYSDVLTELGITQIKANVGQGRQKGKIERFFGVIQSDLAKLAGYIGNSVATRTKIENQTSSKIDRRTGKATSIAEDRLYTVEELQTIIDNWTAKQSDNYKIQETQLITATELESIRTRLGKKEIRTLHKEGINLNGYQYISSALWEKGLTSGYKVEVYEDIDNINTIYVYHNGKYIANAYNRNLGVEAMSLEEHKKAKKANHQNHIAPLQKEIAKAEELYQMYQDIKAEELLKATPEYAKPKPKETPNQTVESIDPYLELVRQQA